MAEQYKKLGYVKAGLATGGASIADLMFLSNLKKHGIDTEIVTGFVDDHTKKILNKCDLTYYVDSTIDRESDVDETIIRDSIMGKLATKDAIIFSQAFCSKERALGEAALSISKDMACIYRQHNYPTEIYSGLTSGVASPITSSMQQYMEKLNDKVAAVAMPPYIDQNRFIHDPTKEKEIRMNVRDNFHIDHDAIMICQPTRVSEEKGLEYSLQLARAIKRLTKKRTYVVVAGGNEAALHSRQYKEHILALADTMKFNDLLFLDGKLDYEFTRMADVLIASDLVAFPSNNDTFGLALAEASLCKKPVVTKAYVDENGANIFNEVYGDFFAFLESPGAMTPSDNTVNQICDFLNNQDDFTDSLISNQKKAYRYTLSHLDEHPETIHRLLSHAE